MNYIIKKCFSSNLFFFNFNGEKFYSQSDLTPLIEHTTTLAYNSLNFFRYGRSDRNLIVKIIFSKFNKKIIS